MKRGTESVEIQSFDIVKCLMLLSQGIELSKPKSDHMVNNNNNNNVFECKTCHRCFPSFQALGGHRASHNKRPKLMGEDKPNGTTHFLTLSSSTESKVHECFVCGQRFSMGQALGGHMRRHRVVVNESFSPFVSSLPPVLKRSDSCGRVVCLDLNLTPLENDLQLLFGNKGPKVDLCI